jgi:hypothetical protein
MKMELREKGWSRVVGVIWLRIRTSGELLLTQ